MKRIKVFLPVVVLPLLASVGACFATADQESEDEPSPGERLGQASSALIGTPLASVPNPTTVPAGYGNYCSASYPGGIWHLYFLSSGDTCQQLGTDFGQNGTIARAGYFSNNGTNNVQVRCADGSNRVYRGSGNAPLQWAYAAVNPPNVPTRLTGCVFTASPVSLPLFGWPYESTATVTSTTVFTYDHYLQKWDPTAWGQPADSWQISNCPNASQDWCSACAVDRTGTEKARCQSCTSSTNLWQCDQKPSEPGTAASPNFGNEPAYDWSVPNKVTKLLAVAGGIVRGTQCRYIGSDSMHATSCTKSECEDFANAAICMEELFIESQIGTDAYAEHFVAAYHHLDPRGQVFKDAAQVWWPTPPNGATITQGQVVAIMGESGAPGNPVGSNIHLDFQVLRLTNITGARQYVFQPVLGGYGFNGWQGIIDPFGWAAPVGVDPGAWKFIGFTDPAAPASVTALGAFSLNLWKAGVQPPTNGPIVN